MNKITREEHPILFYQTDKGVKTAATDLYDEYHSPSSIAARDKVAALALQIQQGNLVFVDANGKALTGTADENRKATVTKIFGELDLPSSTMYLWISQLKVRNTYPKPIRDAAAKAGLNLALDHVRAEYDKMLKPGELLDGKTDAQLNKLDALSADGVILKLKTARKPPPTTSKSKGIVRFQELLKEAFDYASDEELFSENRTSRFTDAFSLITSQWNQRFNMQLPLTVQHAQDDAAKAALHAAIPADAAAEASA